MISSIAAIAQVEQQDCDIVKSATKMMEKGDDGSSYYRVDGDWFYDYSNNGKEYIKSKIEWQDDCTYMLTLVETNMPNFALEYGTKLRVQITEVNGNEASYEYLPIGTIPGGVLIIE